MPIASPNQPSQIQGVQELEAPMSQRLWLEVFPRKLGHQEVKKGVFGWLEKSDIDSVPAIMAAETYAATHRCLTTSGFRITKGNISVLFVIDQLPYGQKALRIGTIDELGEEHQRYEKSGGDPDTAAFFFDQWQRFRTHPLLQPQAHSVALQQPHGQPATYSQQVRDITNSFNTYTSCHSGPTSRSNGTSHAVFNASASPFVPRQHLGTASPSVQGSPGVDFLAPVAPSAMRQQDALMQASHGGRSSLVPAQAHEATSSPPVKSGSTMKFPPKMFPSRTGTNGGIQAFRDPAARISQIPRQYTRMQAGPGGRPSMVQAQANEPTASSPKKTDMTTNYPGNEDPDWTSLSRDIQAFGDSAVTFSHNAVRNAFMQESPRGGPPVAQAPAYESTSSSPEKSKSTMNSGSRLFSSRTSPDGGLPTPRTPAEMINQPSAQPSPSAVGPPGRNSKGLTETSRNAPILPSVERVRDTNVTVGDWLLSFHIEQQRAILNSIQDLLVNPPSPEVSQQSSNAGTRDPTNIWTPCPNIWGPLRDEGRSRMQRKKRWNYVTTTEWNPDSDTWEPYKALVHTDWETKEQFFLTRDGERTYLDPPEGDQQETVNSSIYHLLELLRDDSKPEPRSLEGNLDSDGEFGAIEAHPVELLPLLKTFASREFAASEQAMINDVSTLFRKREQYEDDDTWLEDVKTGYWRHSGNKREEKGEEEEA